MLYLKAKTKKKLPSEKSLPALKKELDRVFNAFIRARDTRYDKGQPYFICISCDEPKPIDQMDAGHFHSAGHNEATRWDERNVNGQCRRCNRFLHGNLLGYQKGMLKKYGQTTLDQLEIKRHNRSKMFRFEVALLIETYRQKLKTTRI